MTFQIDQQTNRLFGCIPACATSVLKHLGHKQLPVEQQLIDLMGNSGAASGFKQLAAALGANCKVVTEEKLKGAALEARLTQLVTEGHLVLVALAGSPSAHCVVVVGINAHHVQIHDPWDAKYRESSTVEFLEKAAGDIAVLSLP